LEGGVLPGAQDLLDRRVPGIEELQPPVHGDLAVLLRAHHPAHVLSGVEEGATHPGLGERAGRCEAGHAGPNDGYLGHVPLLRFSLNAGWHRTCPAPCRGAVPIITLVMLAHAPVATGHLCPASRGERQASATRRLP